MRIVTLLPSATEIVYALGLEPVAVSHECDHPPAAADKPAVNRVRIDPDADSESINEQVLAAERDHGGVYEIDAEALAAADPDLIVTQGICDVCAVDRVLVDDAVDDLGLDADVLTTDPHSLADVLADIRRIGDATGTADRAADLVADLQRRIEAVESAVEDAAEAPRVLVLDWMDPVMVAGHWVPGMVARAGGRYGLGEPEGRSVPTEWADVVGFDPEVLIVSPCGFPLEQTIEHVDELTSREEWETLTAVKSDRVYAMDGHQYFNRPGPRLVDSLEYLAGLIHPDLFEQPPADVRWRPTTRKPAES